MEIREYLRALRSRWMIIVVTVAVVVLGALGASLLMQPQYQASTRLFVSTSGGTSVGETYQNNLFSQQRVASYTQLVTDEELATRTIAALGLDMTAEQLVPKVSAISQPQTVLLDIKVLDDSPTEARDIANAMADQFVGLVRELETPDGGGAPSAGVKVVQQAKAPSSPVSPKTDRNVAIAVLAGLILGVGLAVLRDRLDNTVKGRRTVEAATDNPLVGSIPYDRAFKKEPTVSFQGGRSASAEAFRELRTNLQFIQVDHPPRVLVVTSAVPDEGKTTIALNLALALAEAGHRVVLIEGDLRRPRLSRYLGLIGSVGLSTVLAGQATVSDVLQPTKFENLQLVASGPLPPNPSELLGSEASRSMIDELRARFDYVVIDGSPLLPVTDSAVLATYCDGALIVARTGKTKREQLSRAIGNLDKIDARVLGIVLSMTPTKGRNADEYASYYDTDTSLPQQQPVLPSAPRRESQPAVRKHSADHHVASGESPATPNGRTPYTVPSGE